ncbi:tetratricopeptide repeat protein [Chryseobacterium indologenes]|uniref:tetratricopeptide repeat protein n=1 Tax=Chryseobacterium indologenes TaxID=253 RepID=UPI0023E8111D|nr:tetratricopeptide repeat protein [Chryseobacterium indologenes]WET47867.1 tetratricopeptide repeat protein [Chryseobacterium indologenes]
MNPRVLELIKNPKNIQSEDLGLLKEEIHAFPYIQNIRALHLYGVHLYEKENYQKELSTTAAYTTDKKILYQLINGKIQQEVKQEVTKEKTSVIAAEKPVKYNYNVKGFPIKREDTVPAPEKNEAEEKETCLLQPAQEVKHLYVNGERNRILFEGEENFLDEKNPETIDLESTLESGTLVTQKSETETMVPVSQKDDEVQQEIEENAGEDFTLETVINEDQIASEAVEEKVEEEENLSFEETESLSPETGTEENIAEVSTEDAEAIADEEIPVSEIKEDIADDSGAELSFHGTDAFLPDVKIQANNEEAIEAVEVSPLNVNKHEEEMRRLIEEVEKKMKETKSVQQEEQIEPKIAEDHEISFAETQSFHFWSNDQESSEKSEEVKEEPIQEVAVEETEPEVESTKETVTEIQTPWKPMSLESNMPDSLINKKPIEIPVVTETPSTEIKVPNEEIVEKSETIVEAPTEDFSVEEVEEQSENTEEEENVPEAASQKNEEVPVMNVSFFGSDISSLKVGEASQDTEEPIKEEPMKETAVANSAQINSNVPGFINTWQSWLKIDRTDEVEKVKEEIKEKAIETFIENNPRISQLKEESTYVVKEKNDDISHLMTETLANLYFEQKLYSKAIKAFEILIKKHPEKKEYFETRIKEIKDFRSKN